MATLRSLLKAQRHRRTWGKKVLWSKLSGLHSRSPVLLVIQHHTSDKAFALDCVPGTENVNLSMVRRSGYKVLYVIRIKERISHDVQTEV
jgi:hypothetical protein